MSLVCCPHAGGTADFFRDWQCQFPPDIQVVAVQYPGHGDRVGEPCLNDVGQLGAQLAVEVERVCAGEVIMFGHSFGAAVAFEVAARLAAQEPALASHGPKLAAQGAASRGPALRAVVISARVAPHHEAGGTVHLRGDAAIWHEMVRLGGTPPEIADDDDWRDMLTPSVRADFRASETYRPSRVRLACPVTVMLGDDDDDLPRAAVDAWREYTESEFAVRVFDGAHFYLVDHVADIAAEVSRLASMPAPRSLPDWQRR